MHYHLLLAVCVKTFYMDNQLCINCKTLKKSFIKADLPTVSLDRRQTEDGCIYTQT